MTLGSAIVTLGSAIEAVDGQLLARRSLLKGIAALISPCLAARSHQSQGRITDQQTLTQIQTDRRTDRQAHTETGARHNKAFVHQSV